MNDCNVIKFPTLPPIPSFMTINETFEWSDEQTKLEMIWQVAHMETINSVTKRTLLNMLRYLTDLTMEER